MIIRFIDFRHGIRRDLQSHPIDITVRMQAEHPERLADGDEWVEFRIRRLLDAVAPKATTDLLVQMFSDEHGTAPDVTDQQLTESNRRAGVLWYGSHLTDDDYRMLWVTPRCSLRSWSECLQPVFSAITEYVQQQFRDEYPEAVAAHALRESGPGLPQVVISHPNDDEPRLVFADLLEEDGDPRAEFIRVQCQLAQLETGSEREELFHRSLKLLARHRADWEVDLKGLPISNVSYFRGFIEEVELTAHQFLKHGDAIQERLLLLQNLVLTRGRGKAEDVCLSPHLSKLKGVTLSATQEWVHDFLSVLNRRHTPQLRHLGLRSAKPQTAALFAELEVFEQLESLELSGFGLDCRVLFERDILSSLRALRLCDSTASALRPVTNELGRCKHLRRLERLDLHNCRVGHYGLAALLHGGGVSELRYLNLKRTGLDQACVNLLAREDRLQKLHVLEVFEGFSSDVDFEPLRERYPVVMTDGVESGYGLPWSTIW